MELPRQGEGNDLQILKFGIPNLRVPPPNGRRSYRDVLGFPDSLGRNWARLSFGVLTAPRATRGLKIRARAPSIIPTNEKGRQ